MVDERKAAGGTKGKADPEQTPQQADDSQLTRVAHEIATAVAQEEPQQKKQAEEKAAKGQPLKAISSRRQNQRRQAVEQAVDRQSNKSLSSSGKAKGEKTRLGKKAL